MTGVEGLNAAQRAAVEHEGGPLLVLAGAGSGKTRVITHRIADRIRRGARPESCVALTFTNKAAREMRERVIQLVGPAGAAVRVSTFHSACARILRSHAYRVGLRPGFSIYDEDDQLVTVREVAARLSMEHDAASAKAFRARIEAVKQRADRVEDVASNARGADGEAFAALFEGYQAALTASNACDFGDLVAHVVHALEDDPTFRETLRGGIAHLLVDEFQDTNVAQFALIRLLAPTSGDVAAVGDDDQAIYGWRGATVENVRRFEQEFTPCRVVALEQNYRSGPAILDAAHAVVSKLAERMPKRLRTDRTDHEPVRVFIGRDDREEAEFVVREIARLRGDLGLTWGDFAVFFRTNAQSRAIEEALRARGVSHAVQGATAFYDRREVKDVLAYLRLAVNPSDEVAFRRVVNTPRRGIGDASARRIIEQRESMGAVRMADAARACALTESGRRSKARSSLLALADLLDELERLALSADAAAVIEAIVVETDYERYLRESDPVTGDDRVQNVRDLHESAREFDRLDPGVGAVGFIEHAALDRSVDLAETDLSRVQLMTVHAAKGLEFPVVFVTGLEDRLFPLVRRTSEPDLEEERRLCYVAFTRAERRLFVSAAMRRRLHGITRDADPSAFLLEIPDTLVEVVAESASGSVDWRRARGMERSDERQRQRAAKYDEFDQRPWQERHAAVPEGGLVFDDDSVSRHAADALEGRQVRHRLFGDGVVLTADGHGPKARLTIEFPSCGRKQVVRSYVELVG